MGQNLPADIIARIEMLRQYTERSTSFPLHASINKHAALFKRISLLLNPLVYVLHEYGSNDNGFQLEINLINPIRYLEIEFKTELNEIVVFTQGIVLSSSKFDTHIVHEYDYKALEEGPSTYLAINCSEDKAQTKLVQHLGELLEVDFLYWV